MENLNHLLKRLLESKIEFVLIGGYAAVLHGSSQVTQDIDISLDDLIEVKRAMSRPKDKATLEELECVRQKIKNGSG